MIICLSISQRTKDELDTLLKVGEFRDYSEAAAVAIANQLLLQSHGGTSVKADRLEASMSARSGEGENGKGPDARNSNSSRVPEFFSYLGTEVAPPQLAEAPSDSFAHGQAVTVDQWIFGQHNKLLPVKATCRAMARLIHTNAGRALGLAKTASEIASQAVKLGDYLRHLDQISNVHRDDALSFAFPNSESPNGDKSRLRYANQFVVSATKQGTLSGLPVELKLINRDLSNNSQVSLTEAGWLFAALQNPILDEGRDGRHSKFSVEEIEFLLDHIRQHVPAEAFAFKVALEAIAQGAHAPEKLDDALAAYLPQRPDKPFTRAFLTTQRAGVVSRMIELGLIRRVRDGINVSYIGNASTFEFSPNSLQKVVQTR
jgi:hypothetical protein